MAHSTPLAFDVGLNNGDDSDYYLRKGFRVVGIDANPDMCEICRCRFRDEIDAGLMTVLNVGLSDRRERKSFSVNVLKPAISTFEPDRFDKEAWAPKEWKSIEVDVLPISEVVGMYGVPTFMKIDIEFHDRLVLADMLGHNIVPDYITSEVHERECFDTIVKMGYRRFRLMPGVSVHDRFGATEITRLDGTRLAYSFPFDASGPFGEDFPDPWMDAEDALEQLLAHGLGWIDVHARH